MNKPPKWIFIFLVLVFVIACWYSNDSFLDDEVFLAQNTDHVFINDKISSPCFVRIILNSSIPSTLLMLNRSPPI